MITQLEKMRAELESQMLQLDTTRRALFLLAYAQRFAPLFGLFEKRAGLARIARDMSRRDEIRAARAKVKATYGNLYDQLSTLLFQHDPAGINFETNHDEYEPEVDTILPRLAACASALEVRRVLHEEFVRWFEADLVGPEERYDDLAHAVWQMWKNR